MRGSSTPTIRSGSSGRRSEAFRAQRAEVLEVLERLPLDAWERTATVTGMIGDVYERTAHY